MRSTMAAKLTARALYIRGTKNELEVMLDATGVLGMRFVDPAEIEKAANSMTLEASKIFDSRKPKGSVPEDELKKILNSLAVSDFGIDPKKCGYLAKVRLIQLFRDAFDLKHENEKP